ncbi:unnamed protein product [Lactuca saligna]|uniref:Zinc finger GRF-type domain-containing protein n=1 Tax=Lactuca saligna TaxID=75948 RepID=A0AA35V2Y3_LACSI|nr:unnamed protein product [Lactuca saligna]
MSSSSSTNIRMCYCGDRAGMWTSWTRKNPGRRFFGCRNYMDEEKNYGYFHCIDPPLLNKWYKERMYELGAVANEGVAIRFNNPVNEGEIPVDGHIASVNVDVPIAPVNALEPDNQIAMCENIHVLEVPTRPIFFSLILTILSEGLLLLTILRCTGIVSSSFSTPPPSTSATPPPPIPIDVLLPLQPLLLVVPPLLPFAPLVLPTAPPVLPTTPLHLPPIPPLLPLAPPLLPLTPPLV